MENDLAQLQKDIVEIYNELPSEEKKKIVNFIIDFQTYIDECYQKYR
jgi:hypothetical protein